MTLRLAPIPAADGVLELLYVAQPTAVGGAGTTISVPEDYVDAVFYGALSDLLGKTGRGGDPPPTSATDEAVW